MKSWPVQPFASNDIYICPDCGAEVRVGARRCPGCGPFRPITSEIDDDEEFFAPPDSLETAWQEEYQRQFLGLNRIQDENAAEMKGAPKRRFSVWFLVILATLTLLSGIMAAVKMFWH